MKNLLLIAVMAFSFHASAQGPQKSGASFKSTLKTLLEASPEILAQQLSVDSADSTKTSKALYWTPNLSAGLRNYSQEGIWTESKTTSLTASMNLFKFGSSHLAYKAADAQLNAERLRLMSVKENRETFLADLLFQYIRLVQSFELQKKTLALKQDSFQVAQERYRVGQLPAQEMEKVRVELESAKVSMNEAELNQIKLSNRIRSVTDIDLQSSAWISQWPFEEQTQKKWDDQKLRPARETLDYKTLLAEKDSNLWTSKSVWRGGYLPSLDLVSTWNNSSWNRNVDGSWGTAITLTIPLWDQLSASAASATYANEASKAGIRANQALREAELNLQSLQTRAELTRQNVLLAKSGSEKLNELRLDSLRRFRLGRSTVNDLLLDENRYLEAENTLLNSRYAYHQILVEICHQRNESLLNCY